MKNSKRMIARRAALFALLWWILAEGRLDGWLLCGIALAAASVLVGLRGMEIVALLDAGGGP